MLFSSISFLYFFLPAVLLCYFVLPNAAKNAVLFLFSLGFYFWGEPKYVLLMLFSITTGYIFGILIEKFKGGKAGKAFLIISVCITVSLLLFFKYTDFFIRNINTVSGANFPLPALILPIGISFYTFQILSYTIDVYRGQVAAQKSYLKLATYVALFPQLIAGPIVRYSDVEKELTHRTHSLSKFAQGGLRFVIGLSKKVLIANILGELCENFRASGEKTVLYYWVYAIAFSLHIYFDFSGYSDMAIGLGKIFGFGFPENFDYPYISRSITEFWRRWHMTLGSWFRDYVYIPLGGNRVSTTKWLVNIFIVWFLTGFWHGADWTFIVWGLFFAVLLVLEKIFLKKFIDGLPSFVRRIYVLFFVIISFVIFNANGMAQALSDIAGMFIGTPFGFESLYAIRSYAVVLTLGIIGATPIPKIIISKIRDSFIGEKAVAVISPIFAGVLLLICTAYLVDGSFNPFLYFRF